MGELTVEDLKRARYLAGEITRRPDTWHPTEEHLAACRSEAAGLLLNLVAGVLALDKALESHHKRAALGGKG